MALKIHLITTLLLIFGLAAYLFITNFYSYYRYEDENNFNQENENNFTQEKNFTNENYTQEKILPNNEIKTFQPYEYKVKNITLNITHPLLIPNIRWASIPILVKIDNSTCGPDRVKDIRYAMLLWQMETDNFVKFREVEDNYQVLINCTNEVESRREGEYIITKLGEGGPTKILQTDFFNITVKAMAKIVTTTFDCVKPIRIIHELGHVLGLDHVDDPKSIMYPYEDCQQDFTPEIRQTIKELYKIEGLPDLYFVDVKIISSGPHLNISFVVKNRGISSSPSTKVRIEGDNVFVKDYTIDPLDIGRKLVRLDNIYVKRSFNSIKLTLDPDDVVKEFDEENNQITLEH